jgi:subtilisin family serine protease
MRLTERMKAVRIARRIAVMPTKYLVLRTNVPLTDSFVFSSPSSWSASIGGPTDLSIETFDGHETDVGDLRADPQNAAVMDAEVELKLIEPQSKAAATVNTLQPVGAVRMPIGLLAVGAHTAPFTGQGVSVAILDTGIDETHPAFMGKTLVKHDFTGDSVGSPDDVRDVDGHGTHCAATICGALVGDTRVGVAPGVVTLCVGKVLGQRVSTLEMLLKGMLWAVLDHKASIVSMSLGYDLAGNTKRMVAKGVDPALAAQAAMRQQSDIIKGIGTLRTFLESQSPNVVFVAATGNESRRPQFVLDAGLPAAELFSVGAVGPADGGWDIAPFSNGRAQVVAPGMDVLSASPGGSWALMSGTSMATPHVAGVAALWTEKLRNDGSLSVPEAVRSAMKTSAIRQPLLCNDIGAIGAGMIQAPQV